MTCVLESKLHPEETVRQAIRRSLRGQAARVAMHLGPTANSTDILKKLEGVYGSVEVGQALLSEFYAARQKKGEDVVSWGCRLEDLMDRAQRQGLVPEREANEMLRAQFWANLNQKLKDSSRHTFDTIKDFDALRVEIRCIEREYKNAETEEVSEGNKSKPATQSQRAAASITEGPPTHEQESVNELKGIVSQMTNQLASMQQQMHVMGQMQQRPVYPNFPPPPGQYNPLPQLRNPGSVEPSRFQMGTQGISQDVRQSAMGGGQNDQRLGGMQGSSSQSSSSPQPQNMVGNGCFKCGIVGHYKWECPLRNERVVCYLCHQPGHAKRECPYQHLNMSWPLSKGGQ